MITIQDLEDLGVPPEFIIKAAKLMEQRYQAQAKHEGRLIKHAEAQANYRLSHPITIDHIDHIDHCDQSDQKKGPLNPPSSPSNPISPLISPQRKALQKAELKTQLPESWQPEPDWLEYGKSKGLSEAKCYSVLEAMRQWAGSKGAVMQNWNMCLKGFLRRDSEGLSASPQQRDFSAKLSNGSGFKNPGDGFKSKSGRIYYTGS
jgi:hypothetical protein